MLHLRLLVPADLLGEVTDLLAGEPGATHLVVVREVGVDPAGCHLVLADVAREAGDDVVESLKAMGLERDGAITITTVAAVLSDRATEARREAPGIGLDAVVWEEVVARTSEEAQLSWSFLVFLVASALVAAVGILTDSQILIVAAMVLGPEFGPLAGICTAAVSRRWRPAGRSAWALVVGFPVAVLPCAALAAVADAAGRVPATYERGDRPLTSFISNPDGWSVLVAVLAGVAGMVSLTAAKSGALVGIAVSITTIPAVANVGVAAVLGHGGEAVGALAQLAVNTVGLVGAGTATLAVQRRLAGSRPVPT